MIKKKSTDNKKRNRIFARRKGIGTLEVVIIIAVLLSVAMIFRQSLTAYAKHLISTVFSEQNIIDDLNVE